MTLPLLIGIDINWDTRGIHGHVWFSHTDAGNDNLFGSIKIFFRQNGIQPNIGVIFWVKVKSVNYFDKQPYKSDVLVLF